MTNTQKTNVNDLAAASEAQNYLVSGGKEVTLKRTKRKSFSLTPRELEVLHLIVAELNSKQISQKLFISLHTVLTHRKNLKKKLKVKSVVGLVKWWLSRNNPSNRTLGQTQSQYIS